MAKTIVDKKTSGIKTKASIEEIEEALIKAHGLVAVAAKIIVNEKRKNDPDFKISQQAIYERIRRSSYLQEVLHRCDEETLDFVEGKLMTAISNGNLTAIIFYLKCKGKRRGYIERVPVEVSGPDGAPLSLTPPSFVINFTDKKNEETETETESEPEAG